MNRKKLLKLVAGFSMGGTAFQFGGCVGPGDLLQYMTNLNPCNSILVCDPIEYRFITSGYEGPGVDPDIDPACTFPPFCANDPFVPQNP